MKRFVISVLLIVSMTSCDKWKIVFPSPFSNKAEFIKMTITCVAGEFELEGHPKKYGFSCVNCTPWISIDHSEDMANESDSLFYKIYLYCSHDFHEKKDGIGVHFQPLSLHVPRNSGWLYGFKYSLNGYEHRLHLSNERPYEVRMAFITSPDPASVNTSEPQVLYNMDESYYNITSCDIERIQPSVNRDGYYAVRFNVSGVDEDGNEIVISGLAQNYVK